MSIYKLSTGWLVDYNKNMYIHINKKVPYLGTIVNYIGNKETLHEKMVEFHTLPEPIKTSMTAIHSTLNEEERKYRQKLEAYIAKIKGEQNGD